MKRKERIELIRQIEKELGYGRFVHTMGVAEIAAGLAVRYGVDMERAELAGLLHDCAKCLTLSKMRKICDKAGMEISEYEAENPALLHSKAGRVLAMTRYGVTDSEILSAIEFHTTGRPAMSLLEKIIFVADYIEPGRDTAPDLPLVRRMAYENIDACILKILHDTLNYLSSGSASVDPMTQKTYDYYSKAINELYC